MDDLMQRIYRAFSPKPLTADQQHLYVKLDAARGNADVVCRLANRIRLQEGPTCQVLAGHDGSGKSTELYRLQRELETGDAETKRYFVVLCEADKDIDRNDVDFPEILIAIVRQMAEQLKTRGGIVLKPGYFKGCFERLQGSFRGQISLDQVELDLGLLKLSGTTKNSPDARAEVRKLLEPDANNWIAAANDAIGEAVLKLSKKGYSGLVVLVDDLDKMVLRPHETAGCSTQEYLFVHRAAQLRAFKCHVVYTMPLELAYSHQEQTIARLYGGSRPVIPMVRMATPPPNPEPYRPGVELFRQVIAARLREAKAEESDLFENESIRDELIRLSGGQPTELMSLVRESIVTHGLPIDHKSLDRARREGRRSFARQFRADHWPILEEVRATGRVTRTLENDTAFRELVESRAILLYINDDEWYGLNPLAADLKPPTPSPAQAAP